MDEAGEGRSQHLGLGRDLLAGTREEGGPGSQNKDR